MSRVGFYTELPPVETILPRKFQIEDGENLIIQGITQSGKTSLLFDYISKLNDKFLYIDFDEVESPTEVLSNLVSIGDEYRVKYLFLDLYNHSFENVALPEDIEQIVACSWRVQNRDGFQLKRLYPLSFEEFLVFKNSTESVEHTFSRYTKIGGFPIFARLSDYFLFKQVKRLFYFSLDTIEIEILQDIAQQIGYSRSRFQIFNSISSHQKLSKDKFYRVFKELIDSQYIITSEEFNGSKNRKRFYFIDSAIKNSFGQKRSFTKLFENLVASELYKSDYQLNYFKGLDFYITSENRGVQPKPFIDEEEIVEYTDRLLATVKSLKLNSLEIVTVSLDLSFKVDGITVDVISFNRWALL